MQKFSLIYKVVIIGLVNVICFEESLKNDLLIDIVKDLIITDKSASVISYLCCSQGEHVKLSTLFMKERYKYAAINHLNNKNTYLDNIKAHHTIFLADVKCSGFEYNINQANKNNIFYNPFRWLIFGGEYKANSSVVPSALINSNILLNSEVLVIFSSGNETFLLYLIFKTRSNTIWRNELYGTWTKKGLKKAKEMSTTTAYRRTGFSEINIRVNYVVLHNDTHKYINTYENNHLDSATRVSYWSINALLDLMRCNRTYLYTDNWGYFINNSWTGLTGSIFRDECDLSGTPMFRIKKRLSYLQYLTTPVKTKVKFIFRQPPLSYEHNLYVLAFTNLVWVSVLGLIIILIIILFVSAYWEYKRRNKMLPPVLTLQANITDIVILVLGAICQQGSHVELKSTIGRVVMLTLFLISTFLYTSYSANIVVLLQSSASDIRTLKDLLQSKLELGVENITYNRYYFAKATEPTRKSIYQTKIAPPGKKPNFFTLEEGVKKIKDEPFGFNMELGTGYKFVERYFFEAEKCSLTEIQFIEDQDPLLTCQLHSPFHEIFKIGLSRIEEHGINTRHVNQLYTKKPKCSSQGGIFQSVSFRDSYPALLIFSFGVISSALLLLLENILYKIRKPIIIDYRN